MVSEISLFDPLGNMQAFFHKRKSFEQEKELRAFFWSGDAFNNGLGDLSSGGARIKIDLKILVQNIYISPESPVWITDLLKSILQRYKIKIPVINSALNGNPLY